MPRSITPTSVRMTKGTCLPLTVVVATSAGREAAEPNGLIDPSVDLYDHDVFVGASQSSFVGAPSPAACVVHTHGSRCAPANIGPFLGWLTTVSATRVPPATATSAFFPSRNPSTTPRRTSPS